MIGRSCVVELYLGWVSVGGEVLGEALVFCSEVEFSSTSPVGETPSVLAGASRSWFVASSLMKRSGREVHAIPALTAALCKGLAESSLVWLAIESGETAMDDVVRLTRHYFERVTYLH